MEYRKLGITNLLVSSLGFGAGHIGSPQMTEDQAGTLINRAIDRGVNFVDTARSYGLSEERIGRHLSWRRHDIFLCTKVGYGVEGAADWSYQAIFQGAVDAIGKLQTNYLDIVLLHSCPLDVLDRDETSRALEDLKRSGLVRFTGYSGENAALDKALTLGQIEVVETSINICDQGNLESRFTRLDGRGVIAKRPLANAFWRFKQQPLGDYSEEYWKRWQTMGDPFMSMGHEEAALRFVLAVPELATAIVGTSKIEKLEQNIEHANRGPLAAQQYDYFRKLWAKHGKDWQGQV